MDELLGDILMGFDTQEDLDAMGNVDKDVEKVISSTEEPCAKIENQRWSTANVDKVDGGGKRWNEGKTPFRYIPLHLLAGAARVLHKVTTRKDKPYPEWNWTEPQDWSVPYECLLRHLEAWYRGEDNDPETGEHHLSHVLCNALFAIHYIDKYPERDDRPKGMFGESPAREAVFEEMGDSAGGFVQEVEP